DDAATLGAERSDQQRHAGANVGAGEAVRLAIELAWPDHDSAMGIAEHDPCAHTDQPIHEEQPALEHILVDARRATRLGGHNQGYGDQISIEAWPGHRLDFGDRAMDVVPDA